MKKVLIVINQLNIGGVSKALIELVKAAADAYDISVLLLDPRGDYVKDLPQSVKVLKPDDYMLMTVRSAADLKECPKKFSILRKVLSLWTKLFGKSAAVRYTVKHCKNVPGKYDCAIAFGHPMPDNMLCGITSEIVLSRADAAKKAIVIHCDYSAYGGNSKYNRKLISKFDKVACVSESVGKTVAQCIPDIKDKIVTLYNCHDFDSIRRLAAENEVKYNRTAIVSVARLSPEKGLTRCVKVIADLVNSGYDIEWHIVGAGPEHNALENEIIACGMQSRIILEGADPDPYKYMKNASFLLVPSFHEAAPMVFDEAACLGVPVLTTDTLSAVEMVESRNVGMVCSQNTDDIERMIKMALDKLKNGDYPELEYKASNKIALEQFADLVG